MNVKIEFVIETEDYGVYEFKKEIKKLINDIDPQARLLQFDMHEVR